MQYKPLDKDKKEFRILKFLDPSISIPINEPIRCSIENVPLKDSAHLALRQSDSKNQNRPTVWDAFTECVDLRDSTLEQTRLDQEISIRLAENHNRPNKSRFSWGDFEALSYTWGVEGDQRKIYVNGIQKDVPKNLEEALRALRNLPETQLGMCYWVDSLCIDQDNLKERNEQVKHMSKIYSRARAVVVWLGQEENDDGIAVKTMHQLCRDFCKEDTLVIPEDLHSDTRRNALAVLAFLKKPYWKRAWIIQELAMNHNSTLVICGQLTSTRKMISVGVDYCQYVLKHSEEHSHQHSQDWGPDAWSVSSRVYRLIRLTSNPRFWKTLDNVLRLIHSADATDNKDKVYSILGLLGPKISKHVTPNYSFSEEQIYRGFMMAILKRTKRLDLIILRGIPTKRGWSSWVPDWRVPFERRHLWCISDNKASGHLRAKYKFRPKAKGGHHLVCSGFLVDTIDGVAHGPSSPRSYTQSDCSLTRYSGRVSEALERALVVNHPGATARLLLNIPWKLTHNSDLASAGHRSSEQSGESVPSTYFPSFNEFRERNKSFLIGGETLGDFFPQTQNEEIVTTTSKCVRLAVLSLKQRALVTTRTGYLGLAPIDVRPKDVVVILLGCNFPVILRPCGNNFHRVVGECYVHGLMDGEILKRKDEEDIMEREFVLC